ncbi:acyl-CoA carboxylase subunit epsilon [Actinokineospora sp. NBRC 105648]|uniref:acyl-CoA carboxylase subunit epsilon n=1 Tax=Actinokineospora sp. NBRC 105648 TaxID=3032206 RepID=UPI00249FC2CA|nr:acyl-CoA carboxylase subunit epsilon [Actinokineospora sp. NBRC 105648]GLZ38915.1 hypothetical protein Acsp05_25390 [Actinokineospora sp. NBRC 105648]
MSAVQLTATVLPGPRKATEPPARNAVESLLDSASEPTADPVVIRVVRGCPDSAELAAVTAVLLGLCAPAPADRIDESACGRWAERNRAAVSGWASAALPTWRR